VKFGEEKTPMDLYKELDAIKMEKKEKGKNFNKCFTTVLNEFFVEITPMESLRIEYYTSALIPSIGMFFKQVGKDSTQNFEEAKVVEK